MDYYRVSTFKDVNYQKMLLDYQRWFAGRAVIIKTNYRPLAEFKVVFAATDLPHLMGWQKVINRSAYASRILKQINSGTMTVETTRRHQNFPLIKNRLLNYNYLHEIFWLNNPNICVMTSDMKPNPLRLDIVFYKEQSEKSQIVILGLRKKPGLASFVPTTLHTESMKNNRYMRRRRTSIKSMEWLPRRES